MTSQPVSSIFLCSPLHSGTWRTPSLSIPWCCLTTSFFFFFCPPCLLPPFTVPDLMNGRHVHTTSVCVYLWWSGLRMVRLPVGSWHRLPRWVIRSSNGPIACLILAQTSSLVKWSLSEIWSILRQFLISMACVLLCSSAARVPDSQAYRKMDVTRERISRPGMYPNNNNSNTTNKT